MYVDPATFLITSLSTPCSRRFARFSKQSVTTEPLLSQPVCLFQALYSHTHELNVPRVVPWRIASVVVCCPLNVCKRTPRNCGRHLQGAMMGYNGLSIRLGLVNGLKSFYSKWSSRMGKNSTGNAPGTRASWRLSIAFSAAWKYGFSAESTRIPYIIERARDPVASWMWWRKSPGCSLRFFKSLETALF